MKHISQISIPTPCTQNWENMHPDDKGRFCGSCQKTVVDFTQLSNSQIINVLGFASNICARIDQPQLSSLNNDLAPKYRVLAWQKVGILASVISLMPFIAAKAQVKHKVEQHNSVNSLVGAIVAKIPSQTITGNVVDSISNQPIAFVAIERQGSKQNLVTDSLGHFTIDIYPGDKVLRLSAVGHQTRIIKLNQKQTYYSIHLEAQNIALNPEVLTGLVGGLVVRRSFLWSAWYRIKHPFKHIF